MNKSQAIATLRQLVAEVMQEHRDPECAAYNECDQPGQACMWCSMAQEALDATAVEEAFVGKINGCVARGNPPLYHCALARELQPQCIGYEGPAPLRCTWQRTANSERGSYCCCTERACRASATPEHPEPPEPPFPAEFKAKYPATVEEAFVGKVATVNLASMPCMTDGSPAYTTKPYPIYCRGCLHLEADGDCGCCRQPKRTFATTEHTCPYYAKEENP